MGRVGCCQLPAAPARPLQWRGLGFNVAAPPKPLDFCGTVPITWFCASSAVPISPKHALMQRSEAQSGGTLSTSWALPHAFCPAAPL